MVYAKLLDVGLPNLRGQPRRAVLGSVNLVALALEDVNTLGATLS